MRIISGRLKGRPLVSPKGRSLRPTSDMVKETLFNMLGQQVQDAVVLDLFAGTGNVGIEAISRGAAQAVFVEKEKRHVMCLTDNLLRCNIRKQCIVYHGDATKSLTGIYKHHRIDFAFLDPPYRQTRMLTDILGRMLKFPIMAESGLIVVEHAHTFTPPTEPGGGFSLTKYRRIGDTTLSFYRMQPA